MRPLPRVAWSALALSGIAQPQAWSELAAGLPMSAATFDTARQLLLIAGTDSQQRLFEWDGASVRERLDELAGLRVVESMTCDQGNRRVIAMAADRWVGTWSGGGWSWAIGGQTPAANAPGLIAYDELRQRLVLLTHMGSVHEWDGQQWWALGNAPFAGPYGGGAFAYDPVLRCCLLYGGAANLPGDTWSWDGGAWTLRVAAGAPGTRLRAGLAFDTSRQQLVLYGGSATVTDTWTWNGAAWSLLPTTGSPGPQSQPYLWSDGQGVTLLSSATREIWQLRGSTWTLAGALPLTPSARGNTAFAYDPVRRQVVGFGGQQGVSNVPVDLTMLFDRRWLPCRPATSPPLRTYAHLAWSDQDQKVLLFGGWYGWALGDTWSWDGSNWQQRQPTSSPAPRWAAVMAPDPLGGVMLFGGHDGTTWFGDQWHWNGTDWQQQQPGTMPGARAWSRYAHDPVRGQVVVWGGDSNTALYWNETWVWDGVNWTRTQPTANPTIAALSFWPAGGRILAATTGVSHEWSGSDWVQRPGVGSPAGFPNSPRMVTHHGRGQVLMMTVPTVGLMTTLRARTERYGAECAIGEAPALTGLEPPAPGAPFAIDVATRVGVAPTFLVTGFAAQNVSVGGGCRSLVGMQVGVLFAMANGGGSARFALPIPNDNNLRGVQFTVQAAVWNPTRSPIGSVTLTDGMRMTVGD